MTSSIPQIYQSEFGDEASRVGGKDNALEELGTFPNFFILPNEQELFVPLTQEGLFPQDDPSQALEKGSPQERPSLFPQFLKKKLKEISLSPNMLLETSPPLDNKRTPEIEPLENLLVAMDNKRFRDNEGVFAFHQSNIPLDDTYDDRYSRDSEDPELSYWEPTERALITEPRQGELLLNPVNVEIPTKIERRGSVEEGEQENELRIPLATSPSQRPTNIKPKQMTLIQENDAVREDPIPNKTYLAARSLPLANEPNDSLGNQRTSPAFVESTTAGNIVSPRLGITSGIQNQNPSSGGSIGLRPGDETLTNMKKEWNKMGNLFKSIYFFQNEEVKHIPTAEKLDKEIEEFNLRKNEETPRIIKQKEYSIDEKNGYTNPTKEAFLRLRTVEKLCELAAIGGDKALLTMREILHSNSCRFTHNIDDPNHIINKSNVKNLTPIYLACKNGNLSIVKFIVESGALHNIPCEITEDLRETPLEAAIRWNHIPVVDFLLRAVPYNTNDIKAYMNETENPAIKRLLTRKLLEAEGKGNNIAALFLCATCE